jgi:hypothetical protein
MSRNCATLARSGRVRTNLRDVLCYHITQHLSLHGWIFNTKSNTGSFLASSCVFQGATTLFTSTRLWMQWKQFPKIKAEQNTLKSIIRSTAIRGPCGVVVELGTSTGLRGRWGTGRQFRSKPIEEHPYVVIYRQLKANFSLVSRAQIAQPTERVRLTFGRLSVRISARSKTILNVVP